MSKFKTLKIYITLFAFAMMYLSALLGIGLIVLLSKWGYDTNFTGNHIRFILTTIYFSTIIGTFISTIIAKLVFRPIEEIAEGTLKVAKGDFSHRINVNQKQNFKINELINSFNYMTEELSSIEMFRNDFINNFSHEFKTPISSIIGYAKELKREDLTEEEKNTYLSIIISESERLSTLSSTILLLTKVENQKILSNKSTFQLDEQLRKCILVLQKSWEDKNIDWDLNLEDINYYGDEDLLSQVWVNILHNAIKFSHQNGIINISCKKINPTSIQIAITDNGIGMDEKTIDRVFDKFYQGDTSHATSGNGLGLSLVKKIIELFNGSIKIKSAPNKGTTIIVELPINNA